MSFDPTSFEPPIDPPSDAPDWLSITPEPNPFASLSPAPARTHRELLLVQFEHAFDSILEKVAGGATLENALRDHPVQFHAGQYMRWITSDPERLRTYNEAKELQTEVWAGQIIDIADGLGSIEDVTRSKLRIDSRFRLMAANNRKVYGDVKTIDVGVQISITQALRQARHRVIEGEVIGAAIESSTLTTSTTTEDSTHDDP